MRACLLFFFSAVTFAATDPEKEILIVDGEYRQLYGSIVEGSGVSSDDRIPEKTATIDFALYDAVGPIGRCALWPLWEHAETCDQPELKVEDCPAFGKSVLAIAASWNAAPRVVQSLPTHNRAYRQLMSTWLREQGIEDADPDIQQLLRVDLEGDGTDEVLISATHLRGSVRSAYAGDYSIILLRRIVQGSVQTIALEREFHRGACEAQCEPRRSRIVAVLDVDGDGILEVITQVKSFEQIERRIFHLDKNRVKMRLSWSCGV